MSAFEHGPGDDDDFNFDDESGDSDVEAFKERARKAKDPTDDEDDVEIDPADNEPVVSIRQKKKQERRGLLDELNATRQELARLKGMVEAGAMHRQPDVRDATDEGDSEDDELDEALADIQRKHTEAYQRLRAKGQSATQADKDEYERQVRGFEREKIKLGAAYQARKNQYQTPAVVRQQVIQEQLRREHGDVYALGPRAVAYSRGEFQKLVALGEPDSAETVKKAMDATRIAFNIGRSTSPTPEQKGRFVGAPRGGSGSGGNNGPTSIKMTKELRAMANAAYPEEPDEQKRYKKWANGPGREFLKSQR